ncbi:MAG: hypothetical protein AAFW68_11850 [Pseudomonadota bacterium]
MKLNLVLLALFSAFVNAAANATDPELPGLYATEKERSAADIIAAVHQAAGGEDWRRPKSLLMTGYAVMYRSGEAVLYDDYRMWRVYAAVKEDAHVADGKVRIEGKRNGETVFVIAFDGKQTYDANGPMADQSANARWASNFGFGAIRHALDDGWSQTRRPDDMVDGRLAYVVELKDPAGGVTRFAFAQDDYAILYVGFDTPRGWHERRYSDFFTKPGVNWVQPGRVRLYYDGVKQNEVIWTDFTLNGEMDDGLFKIPK